MENHIDSLEENASLDRTFPYFLSNNLKFTVLTAQPFEHILYDCASNYGFIPSGLHFFSNVIDHQHLPSKIYISRSPIYRNVPVPEWQEIVNQNAQQCSIWQINKTTKRPKVVIPQDCSQKIQSICIHPVGNATYSRLSESRVSHQQLLASQNHLFYLLSQLSAYPSPLGQPAQFASDISAHLHKAFQIFAEFIENETDVSYSTLFASQRSIQLLQLALQKAQHSESWKAEQRQHSNFEQIQSLLNDYSLTVKSIESRVQNLESNRRQQHRPAHGGPLDDRLQGSGFSQHPSKLRVGTNGIEPDDGDDDHDDQDDDQDDATTTVTSNPTTSTTSRTPIFRSPSTSKSTSRKPTLSSSTTSSTSSPTPTYSDPTTSASTYPNENTTDSGNTTDSSEAPWTFSNLFSWEYWYPPNQNSTEPDQENQENQLQYYGTNRNDSFYPEYVYSNMDIVRFWPFSTLLTLAAFHLFAIIEFYINLLWKILTLLLAIHVYRLDRRVSRLEEICDSRDKNQANLRIDFNSVKTGCSRHAQQSRSSQQPPCPPTDPQSLQPLLHNT